MLVVATAFVLINLVVDIVYAYLNPEDPPVVRAPE